MVAFNGQLKEIRQIQHVLAKLGWSPQEIGRLLFEMFPGMSRFASWRYGRGWSSSYAVEEIKCYYEPPPGRRHTVPGLDVSGRGQDALRRFGRGFSCPRPPNRTCALPRIRLSM